MTDDRSLERAARSWLEIGPTQAPTAPWRPRSSASKRHHRNGIFGSRGGCPSMTTACPRRGGRRHRRAARRRRLLHASAERSIVRRRPGPSPVRVADAVADRRPSTPAAVGSRRPRSSTTPTSAAGSSSSTSATPSTAREMPTTDYHPERRRFYFMDPATMTGATAVEFLPGQPATGKTAADISSDGSEDRLPGLRRPAEAVRGEPRTATGFLEIPIDVRLQLLYPDYDPTATKIVYVRVEGGAELARDPRSDDRARSRSSSRPSARLPTRCRSSRPGRRTARRSPSTGSPGARLADSPVVGTIHYGDKPPISGVLSLLDVATGKVTDVKLGPSQLPGDVELVAGQRDHRLLVDPRRPRRAATAAMPLTRSSGGSTSTAPVSRSCPAGAARSTSRTASTSSSRTTTMWMIARRRDGHAPGQGRGDRTSRT